MRSESKNVRKRKTKPKYIDPFNAYTGTVSVSAIVENLGNGYIAFPANMGEVKALE